MNFKPIFIFVTILLVYSCGEKSSEISSDSTILRDDSETTRTYKIEFDDNPPLGMDSLEWRSDNGNSSRAIRPIIDQGLELNLGKELDSCKSIILKEDHNKRFHPITKRDMKYYETRGISCGLQWSNYYVDFNKDIEFDSIMIAMYNSEFDTCLISNFLKINQIGIEFYHLNMVSTLDSIESSENVDQSSLFNLSILLNKTCRNRNIYVRNRLRRLEGNIDLDEFIANRNHEYRDFYQKELNAIFKK